VVHARGSFLIGSHWWLAGPLAALAGLSLTNLSPSGPVTFDSSQGELM